MMISSKIRGIFFVSKIIKTKNNMTKYLTDRLKLSRLTDNIKNDTLAGLVVSLALIPESVAFAFVAGVEPLVALYASAILTLITSLFGGRPGMISAATAPLAVVMTALVLENGIEYLFAAGIVMGVIQILLGVFKIGKFVRLLPYPVRLGFLNGIAIVIGLAQRPQFQNASGDWLVGGEMLIMVTLVIATMLIMWLLPKITKAVPSGLVAIVGVTLAVILLGLDTKTIGDVASVKGGFPVFSIPNIALNWEVFKVVLPYGFIFAAIGSINSLLNMTVVDDMTDSRGGGNKELFGQGLGNIISSLFGGMPGCAMTGQSIININSGGRGRLSGIASSLFLFTFIIVAGTLIESIPVAALVGIMFMVVIGTFSWASVKIANQIPKSDAVIIVLVALAVIFTNTAIAVVLGIILSALSFAWTEATRIEMIESIDKEGVKHYKLHGPLFFGSILDFYAHFDIKNDPKEVYIDFAESKVHDHSGIEAINNLTNKYKQKGKNLHLLHLSTDCKILLSNIKDNIEVNVKEDPRYKVATNLLG